MGSWGRYMLPMSCGTQSSQERQHTLTDFKSTQIEKLLTQISKLEGKSGDAQRKVRDRFFDRIEKLKADCEDACSVAAQKHQQKIDVLEKQLKALGGSR